MKIVAVIPCYNEEKYIFDIVKRTKKFVDEVVVVDNGSYDRTSIEAKKAGAILVYSHKKGMGASIDYGIKSVDADIYITMDGDGQHNPNEIPNLIKPILDSKSELSVGVRINNQSMPKYRKIVNNMLARIYSFGSYVKLNDVQCGFRAYTKAVSCIPLKSSGFGCVIELLVKVRKKRLLIYPVEVECIYHEFIGQNSTLNPIKHGFIVIIGMIRWLIWEKIGL